MSTSGFLENIVKLLHQYCDFVNTFNKLGLTDASINAENILKPILDRIFGTKLINGNDGKVNNDSFDLFDEKKGIYVQVTSNKKRSDKRRKATTSFVKKHSGGKNKQFYILFIAKQCSPTLLRTEQIGNITVEGLNLDSLVRKLYHSKESTLAPIAQLLQEEVSPILIQFNKNKQEEGLIIPLQEVKPVRPGLYINREKLVQKIFEFAQRSNGLIIGGHGYGKSFIIEELQRYSSDKGIPCFIIRIDNLLSGNDDSINEELNAKSRWLDAIASYPLEKSAPKGILIFDAFDTAKDPTKKEALLIQIKKAIAALNPEWSIIVSIRSYDASKSMDLQKIFQTEFLLEPVQCCHIEIPKLNDDEVLASVKENQILLNIYKKASPELRELLRIPYFLKLLESQIANDHTLSVDEIAKINSEETLLSLYWTSALAGSTSSDLLINDITRKLFKTKSLSVNRYEVITEQNSESFDYLNSAGLILDNISGENRIAFSHNILYDYSMSKYVIPSDIEELINLIKSDTRTPFIFRQAFIYYYSRLWTKYRNKFWAHYFRIAKQDAPVFRLFQQTTLNYVAIELYKTPDDLRGLTEFEDEQLRNSNIKKLLEALRFIKKDKVERNDIEFLNLLCKNISLIFLWDLGIQIYMATTFEETKAKPNISNLQLLAQAACEYFDYVLQARKAYPLEKESIDSRATIGIQNLCKLYAYNKTCIKNKIKAILNLLNEENYPISYFLHLGHNISGILNADINYGVKVFEALYLHREKSNEMTQMGGQIMALNSTKSQDYSMMQTMLETEFPSLLQQHQLKLLPFAMRMLNLRSKSQTWFGKYLAKYPIIVNNQKTYFTLDGSQEDILDEDEHGLSSFGTNLFRWLTKIAEAGQTQLLFSAIDIFIKEAHGCDSWRRFIRFLIKFPKLLRLTSYTLLCNDEIYYSYNTTEESGALISAVWPYLNHTQKGKIEKIILGLKRDGTDEDSIKYQNDRISRLLNCIPHDQAILSLSRSFIESHESVSNDPEIKVIKMADIVSRSEDENMHYAGYDPQSEKEKNEYAILQIVTFFNNTYNNVDKKPTKIVCSTILPNLRHLFQLSKEKNFPSSRMQFSNDIAVARAMSILASSGMHFSNKEKAYLKEIALFFLGHQQYMKKQKATTGIEEERSWEPNPRIIISDAISPVIELLQIDNQEEMLSSLADDPDFPIRLILL